MNLLSNSTAFFIMLVLGMAVVGINAATQFRSTVSDTRFDLFDSLLSELPMHLLAVRQRYSLGFLIYISTIEIVYLLLSSSTVLLQAFMQFTGNTSSIGALAANNSEINPYIPILASSVVITATQLKPFSVMENFLRKVSQQVVSNAVQIQKIATRIEETSFPPIRAEVSDQLKSEIWQLEKDINVSCIKAGWSEVQVQQFSELRRSIKFLDSWTNGENSRIFKSLNGITEVAKLRSSLDSQVDTFHDRLRHAIEKDSYKSDRMATALNRFQTPGQPKVDFWDTALSEAEEIKRQLSILLALYLSNLPRVAESIDDENVRTIFLDLLSPPNETGKYSFISTGSLLGFAICFVLFLAYHLTLSASLDVASSYTSIFSPSKVYVQSFHEISVNDTDTNNQVLPESNINTDDESNQDKVSSSSPDDSKMQYRVDVTQYFTRIVNKSISQAFWDACIYSAIFLMAATVAVTACKSSSISSIWKSWSREFFPFWQYVQVGIVSTLLTCVIYSLLLFFRLVVMPSFTMESTILSVTLLEDFKNQLAIGSGVSLMAFPIACCVCYICDRLSVESSDDIDSEKYNVLSKKENQRSDGLSRTASNGLFSSGFYPCRVFSGFLEKRDDKVINIGMTVLYFSLFAGVINTMVMLNGGTVTSPKQLFNAFFLPALAFFIIVSTYFELLTMANDTTKEEASNMVSGKPHLPEYSRLQNESELAEKQTERADETIETI